MRERSAERNGPRRVIFETKAGGLCQGSYVGDWSQDKKDGFGTHISASGDKYEGEWRAGKPHGKGSLWKMEKRLRKRYAGDWVQGKRSGRGAAWTREGAYLGDFLDNVRQGHGKMVYEDGSEYEGEWKHNMRDGYGALRNSAGDLYKGRWSQDKKHGPGKYTFNSTKKILEGDWRHDVSHCGTYRSLDETSFPLPALGLGDPDSLLKKSIADRRQTGKAHTGDLSVRLFDDNDLGLLHHAFLAHDKHQANLVPANRLPTILETCNLIVDPAVLDQVLTDLHLDKDTTTLDFPDFVEMAALLLGNHH